MEILSWVIAIVLMVAAFFAGSFLKLAKVSKVFAAASTLLTDLSDGNLTIEEAKDVAQKILAIFKP